MAKTCAVFLLVLVSGLSPAAEEGPEAAKKDKLLDGVTWTFSGDGGKTFELKSLPQVLTGQTVTLAAQAVFTLDKTDHIGCLWLAPLGNSPGITTGDYGEWSRPLVTEAVVTVNGKRFTGSVPTQVYNRFVLDPADLVKGRNVVTVSARYCNAALKFGSTDPIVPAFALTMGGPEDVEFQTGPVVGAVGPDYFTVCARTNSPAIVTLKVTPSEPAGKEVSVRSERGRFHRFRVAIPKGARSLTYTMTPQADARAAAGKPAGPFTVKMPGFSGASFKLIAVGQSDGGGWATLSEIVRKAEPDILVHAGGMNCFPVLDGAWDGIMFKPCAQLVATVPTYACRGCEEGAGPDPVFAEMIYSPTPDGKVRNWAQVFGNLLLVGIDGDGTTDWSAGTDNYKWLESVLKASKEKFIIVVSNYPGYSSGQGCRPPLTGILLQVRESVMPLLSKYKATAMISSFGHGYERSEPTPDKGVTNLVTSAAGGPQFKASGRAQKNNPFSTAYANGLLYCVFEFKGDSCEMKVLRASGAEADKKTFAPREIKP